jgi:ubiquinone/menaquinone biosynthesis C-methylase UbiE
LKAFNNWIKAVLIQSQTKNMCHKVEAKLDLKRGGDQRILHVLDIGCGRGQDIKKWKQKENRVQYIVAADFSEECIKEYENRWRSEG